MKTQSSKTDEKISMYIRLFFSVLKSTRPGIVKTIRLLPGIAAPSAPAGFILVPQCTCFKEMQNKKFHPRFFKLR
jgi:hypothetical protein